MQITEVNFNSFVREPDDDGGRIRPLAFCSIVLDNALVVHDLKIIPGQCGPFVSMPSSKITDHCQCGCKNHLRACYCNYCGAELDGLRAMRNSEGKIKLFSDIVHPINSDCRIVVQQAVLDAYERTRVADRVSAIALS